MAGGGAGFCQVIITSPMELLKIKGQSKAQLTGPNSAHVNATLVDSKTCSAKSTNPSILREVLKVIKSDGIGGIYRGAGSTLVRDIPFSMTYFPLFAHLNHLNLNEDGTSKPLWSLASGLTAGAFSAWLFTPMDCKFFLFTGFSFLYLDVRSCTFWIIQFWYKFLGSL